MRTFPAGRGARRRSAGADGPRRGARAVERHVERGAAELGLRPGHGAQAPARRRPAAARDGRERGERERGGESGTQGRGHGTRHRRNGRGASGTSLIWNMSRSRNISPVPWPMATDRTILGGRAGDEERSVLAREWRKLGRAATVVAVLTSPATFAVASTGPATGRWAGRCWHVHLRHRLPRRRRRPGPQADPARQPVRRRPRAAWRRTSSRRRRVWYWRHEVPRGVRSGSCSSSAARARASSSGWASRRATATGPIRALPLHPQLRDPDPALLPGQPPHPVRADALLRPQADKGYEPGDADWGVKLEDVRGQAEPKAEVTKVIELWSAGEEFHKAAASPSAACSSSARRARARRCSPRASRPRSTRRS